MQAVTCTPCLSDACVWRHSPLSPAPATSVTMLLQPRVASVPVHRTPLGGLQGLMVWLEEATRVRPGERTTSHS